jgi:hypothetical protein
MLRASGMRSLRTCSNLQIKGNAFTCFSCVTACESMCVQISVLLIDRFSQVFISHLTACCSMTEKTKKATGHGEVNEGNYSAQQNESMEHDCKM